MNPLLLDNTADRHLGRILQLQAQQNGATEFLISDGCRITYAAADRMTDQLAAGFMALGIGREHRVCLYMLNCTEI